MEKMIDKNVVEVISLDEFVSVVSKFKDNKNIFYRGQKDKNFNISCSLSREDGYVENEKNMIMDVLEEKSKDFKGYKAPIEILSKMQHYDIPTRLIDVTINPYIALYFAIEDIECTMDGEVFIFDKNLYDINSKDVNLVSLLSIAEDISNKGIIDLYESVYGNKITEDEVLDILKENKLVEFNKLLSHTNERLYNQEGTFIICTNVVENGIINKQIKEISKKDVSYTIRIPFEYKAKIKEDLNTRYKISQYMVYPELPIFAKYIREKYKSENDKSIEDYNFRIIETDDISHALAKRLSVKIELEHRMSIDIIRKIIHSTVNEYKNRYDVIWLYVSSSKEDTVTYNWTVRVLWIDNNLSKQARPSTFGQLESDGIYWEYGRGLTSMREYYEENIFEDDNKLLTLNYNELQNVKRIYYILKEVFDKKTIDEFLSIVKEYKDEINEIYFRFQEFGLSRSPDTDKYLHLYQQIACDFDNITLVSDNYLLEKHFSSLDKNIYEAELKYEEFLSCNSR